MSKEVKTVYPYPYEPDGKLRLSYISEQADVELRGHADPGFWYAITTLRKWGLLNEDKILWTDEVSVWDDVDPREIEINNEPEDELEVEQEDKANAIQQN